MALPKHEPRPQRRHVARMSHIPEFPKGDFYSLLLLAWDEGFPTDRKMDGYTAHAFGPRVPWAALEHARYAMVWMAYTNAFGRYARQYEMRQGAALVWLATEYGMVRDTDRKGLPLYRWHRPDVTGAVMTFAECARYYGYTPGTVAEYVRVANHAIAEEWSDLWLIANRRS